MKEIRSFKDLKILLTTNKDILKAYEIVKNDLDSKVMRGPAGIQGIDYSVASSNSYTWTMEAYLEQKVKVDKQIDSIRKNIKKLEEQIERIEKSINRLEDLDYRVVYLRDIEGMALYDIADKLNYSYQYIREIYAKAAPGV